MTEASAGLPQDDSVIGAQEIKTIVTAIERIIVANNRNSNTRDRDRHSRAVYELYKLMFGDENIFRIVNIQKASLNVFCLDWIYQGDV